MHGEESQAKVHQEEADAEGLSVIMDPMTRTSRETLAEAMRSANELHVDEIWEVAWGDATGEGLDPEMVREARKEDDNISTR